MIYPTTLQFIKILSDSLEIDMKYAGICSAEILVGKLTKKIHEVSETDDAKVIARMANRVLPALGVYKSAFKKSPIRDAPFRQGLAVHDSVTGGSVGIKLLPVVITYSCVIILPDQELADKATGNLFWYMTDGNTSFPLTTKIRSNEQDITLTCQVLPDTFGSISVNDEKVFNWDGFYTVKMAFEVEVSTYLIKGITDPVMLEIDATGYDATQKTTFFELQEVPT
jgi:hypothetical protein